MTYDFDKIVDRSCSHSVKFESKLCNQISEEAIPMWIADMDFEVAPPIAEAIRKRADHAVFGYSKCSAEYFESVVNWMRDRHNWTITSEWIATAPGVVPALNFAVRAFLNSGDKVIIQQPVYYPFMRVVESNGFEYVNNELEFKHDRYEINFEDFEHKARDPRTKMFILCNPHNPIGRVWSKEELSRLANICLANDVLIISDEIHHDLVFPSRGIKHIPMASLSSAISKRTITCTAPNKSFNIAGLQSANIIIEDPILRQGFVDEINKTGVGSFNPFALVAAEAGYREGGDWLDAAIDYIEGNKQYVMKFVEEKLPNIRVLDSEATFLLWIDFRDLGLDQWELQQFLRHKALVWLDSGFVFGESGSGFERMNIACSRHIVEEAMNRIERAVKSRMVIS
ncbi:pyridoxal phosphate-dependent aminotransferase [Paenibacillus sp. N1-5-1-14]|uniref:MalY/PatB family protein n=1 Tax=Paenibacillus radicibacter TaxID=2972488 RepID=UPI002158F669|nr:MalY/PatB family protein [Paenibacillus radicibacter]MCR8642686.1 pyridoxal phosphate-dependent aminotransferase [Paenibacillus radicibacter]